MDGAVAEYEKLLNQYPGDTEIAERLAGVQLMGRTRDADLTPPAPRPPMPPTTSTPSCSSPTSTSAAGTCRTPSTASSSW